MSVPVRTIEKEDEAEKETADESAPKLDLKFKEGQTIKVNLNIAVSLTFHPLCEKMINLILCLYGLEEIRLSSQR